MSWRSHALIAAFCAGVAALALAGCGFQPLYGGTTAGGAKLGEVMKAVDATSKLVDSASGKIVLQGKGIARAPYNRFQEIFANIRARYDAENRAARSVADSLRTQVAAFLANAA